MTEIQWEQLSFFHKEENWGDPSLMDFELLRTLDLYRHYCGEAMLVTSGVQGQHHQLSLHYSGRAVDVVFMHRKRPLFDLFLEACRFPFSELGVYVDWEYGGKCVGGMHFGLSADYNKKLRKKLWVALDTNKGREYLPANLEGFREADLLKE